MIIHLLLRRDLSMNEKKMNNVDEAKWETSRGLDLVH